MIATQKLQLTAILIEDPKDKGFTAFFAEFPEVVVEGDSEDEAQLNLISTLSTVFQYKRQEASSEKNFTQNFKEKPLFFELETA